MVVEDFKAIVDLKLKRHVDEVSWLEARRAHMGDETDVRNCVAFPLGVSVCRYGMLVGDLPPPRPVTTARSQPAC